MDDAERSDITNAVESLPRTMRLFARREIKKLPSALWEGELVEKLAQGKYNGNEGLLVLSNRRLIFLEQGVFRSRIEDFPIEKISSVQSGTGMMFGELTIFVSGNKAEISRVMPKEHAATLAETLRGKLQTPTSTPATSAPPAAPAEPDVMEQLKKLGELRDAGVLNDTEFETKKAELLKRL